MTATAIILLNFRGSADTLACLDSLLRGTRLFSRLVICDNASPDDSMRVLQAGLQAREVQLAHARARLGLAPMPLFQVTTRAAVLADEAPPPAWVTLIDNQGNWGFAGGNNVGLRLALRDASLRYFWLLNNDTEVPGDTLAELVTAAEARPEVDLWGGTVAYHDAPDQVQALGGGALNLRTGETRHIGAFTALDNAPADAAAVAAVEAELDYALGACMFASRRWLERVGLLCDDYFLYYEELDWASRGRRVGLTLGYAPKAVVLHKEGASIGTAPSGGSILSVRHLCRSRMIYARKFMPASSWPAVALKAVWQACKYALRGRFAVAQAVLLGAVQGSTFRPTH